MFVNLYDDKVIMVKDAKDVEGTLIVSGSANGKPHQKWTVLYTSDVKKDTTKHNFGFRVNEPFYIVSKLPFKRVLECIGASYTRIKKYYKNRTA
jgi:hypothetical protein